MDCSLGLTLSHAMHSASQWSHKINNHLLWTPFYKMRLKHFAKVSDPHIKIKIRISLWLHVANSTPCLKINNLSMMATDKINNKDKLSLVKSLEENGCLKLSIIHSECPKLSHRGSLEISMVRWGGGGG